MNTMASNVRPLFTNNRPRCRGIFFYVYIEHMFDIIGIVWVMCNVLWEICHGFYICIYGTYHIVLYIVYNYVVLIYWPHHLFLRTLFWHHPVVLKEFVNGIQTVPRVYICV